MKIWDRIKSFVTGENQRVTMEKYVSQEIARINQVKRINRIKLAKKIQPAKIKRGKSA